MHSGPASVTMRGSTPEEPSMSAVLLAVLASFPAAVDDNPIVPEGAKSDRRMPLRSGRV